MTVPSFQQTLAAVAGYLDKARTHFKSKNEDPDDIVAIFQDLGLGPRARGAA